MSIKRPSVLFLIAFILGIIIAYSGVPIIFKLIISAIAIFFLLKLLIESKVNIFVLFLLCTFVFSGFLRFKYEEKKYDDYAKNVELLGKGNHIITGKLDVIGKSTNSNYYILVNCISEGKNLGVCRCYFSDELKIEAKIGNLIKVEAGVKNIDAPNNEGEFNQKNYYRSEGISFISFGKKFEIVNDKVDVLKQKIYEIKLLIKAQINKIFNEKDAGLFSAMVTGDKSTIDREQKRLFSDNGIAHILAISGLHLSILGLALFELLRKRFSVYFSAGFVSIFILLYGIFIDAGATSLRAISMLYIRFLALSIGRTYDSKNTLYIICFIFLLLYPYLLFNAGFQFSYVAIFALNEEVYIYHRGNTDKKKAIKIPSVIVLTLFLFPITIYHYFTYPLYSIVLNLIVIPLMSFVLGFGLIGLLASFGVLSFGKMIVFVVHIIFMIYDKLCYFIETLPFHILWLGKPTLYEILYYYFALFLIIYALNKTKNETKENYDKSEDYQVKEGIILVNRIIICIFLLAFSVVVIAIRVHPDFRMTFLSTGQGDAILIDSKNTILSIDGGSSSDTSAGQYIMTPHIKSRAIDHIDYAFISHPDSDHTNAILYIFEEDDEVEIKNLVLPINAMSDSTFDKLKTAANYKNTKVLYAKEGDIFNIKNDLVLKVINPDEMMERDNGKKKKKDRYDVNDMSLSFKLEYMDKSVLFTGDIGKNAIVNMLKKDFVRENLDVDILKVPHHGSKNSYNAEFYKLTSPVYSVISYGKGNSYDHPHQVVVDALEYIGSKVLKTGESGEIDIYFSQNEKLQKNEKCDIIVREYNVNN